MRYYVLVLLAAIAPPAALFSQSPQSAPVSQADPQVRGGKFSWAFLTAEPAGAKRLLGQPVVVADFGVDFQSYQYQIDNKDHDDVSHLVVFRKSTGALVSVTRNYDPERAVDAFFPTAETEVHSNPDPHGKFDILVRRLPGGWLLFAMGISDAGKPTGQIVLMRRSEVRFFYSWLDGQLATK
ncbi:MAG: hypothetical protein ABI823_14540 [Bryobacteraceae bacterium]